jgi:hypothetical protein
VNVALTINGAGAVNQTLVKFSGITGESVAAQSVNPTRELTADHFFAYGTAHPNRFKVTPTGYWNKAGQATKSSSSGDTINIIVDEKGTPGLVGVRRHYTGGGTIKPSGRISEITGKPIQYLTIPINGAAHGKTVAMMRALGVDLYRKGSALFAKSSNTRSDSDVAMFALKKSIGPQQPNPAIIPTPQQYFETVALVVKNLTDPD